MVGFINLGDIKNHLAAFERSLHGESEQQQPLAKTMLVIMVRGLFSGLQYPYVHYPTGSLKGHHLIWNTVGRLERYGFRVMGLTTATPWGIKQQPPSLRKTVRYTSYPTVHIS